MLTVTYVNIILSRAYVKFPYTSTFLWGHIKGKNLDNSNPTLSPRFAQKHSGHCQGRQTAQEWETFKCPYIPSPNPLLWVRGDSVTNGANITIVYVDNYMAPIISCA
jgi:hypothetical protein